MNNIGNSFFLFLGPYKNSIGFFFLDNSPQAVLDTVPEIGNLGNPSDELAAADELDGEDLPDRLSDPEEVLPGDLSDQEEVPH